MTTLSIKPIPFALKLPQLESLAQFKNVNPPLFVVQVVPPLLIIAHPRLDQILTHVMMPQAAQNQPSVTTTPLNVNAAQDPMMEKVSCVPHPQNVQPTPLETPPAVFQSLMELRLQDLQELALTH